ncbi:MAG: alpha-2-macroglobulin family protein, partial [Anaerolineae bacterium]
PPPPWAPWRKGEIVAEGEGVTDADGRLLITLDADLAPLGDDEAVSAQQWTLEATVLDETNFAVSQRGALTVHTGRFYLGLSPRSWVVLAGETAAVDLLALDWEGEPVADQVVEVTLARRTWRYIPTTAPYSSGSWSHSDTVVDTTRVTTDDAGCAVAELVPPDSGSYVVKAEGIDADGNQVSSETYLWVGGPGMAAWQLAEGKVEPVADAETYRPGDTARVLLPTPFEAPFEVLMTLERGGILEVERMTIREANPVIEIPITDAHVPNIIVSFVVIKGVGSDSEAVPDVRIGMVNLEVEPVDQLLDVSVAADCDPEEQDARGRCTFAPGERVDLAVRTRDADGEPVDAEVAVAIVDKAVLALADPNSPTLREAYYAPRPLGVMSGDGLLMLHNRLAEDLEALRRRAEQIALEQGVGGIGGGGGDGAIFAPDVRQEFPDTAYWDAKLRTGASGEAHFTVELPDSLTTWVVDARAVTQATEVGEVQAELVVTKPLIVRPVTPRFLVVGDRATVAAVVQNNTEMDLDVTVSLETNLDLDSPRRSEVRVPAGGRTRVAWTVEAPASGEDAAQFTFSAEGGGYRDAARPSVGRESDHALPIYRYESPDVVSVSGALREAGSRVEVVLVPPEAGPDSTLTLRLEPTLAAAMVEGLDYLEQFPHACTEQLVSRFLPNVVTARALRDLDVEDQELDDKLARLVPEMLAQLYERQNANGGWGWWPDRPSDLQVSAYATLGLIQSQRAGFAVDEQRLNRALQYLHRALNNSLRAEGRTLPQVLALYVLAEASRIGPEASRIGPEGATEVFFEDRETLDVTGRAYLALAMGLADPDDPRIATLLDSLRADASITASGAHWESMSAEHWITWSRATSVVIDALARFAPDDPLLPQAVRWLMVTRQKDHWETTQETTWAVLALTDYMVATGELDAAYDWGVGLNAEALDEGTVSATAQAAIEHTIPVEDLLRRWPNRLEISRGEGPGTLYYTADLALTLPVEELAAESRGMTVQRRYCLVKSLGEADEAEVPDTCEPITSAQPGDLVEVRLTLTVPRQRHYVVLEDAYPAGMEPVDTTLDTAQQEAAPSYTSERKAWWRPSFDREEMRDERAVFYASRLSPGTYEVCYYLRAAVPGEYRVLPAMVSEMYFPEVWSRTEGTIFTVIP